jgi:hypothetical protein
MFKINKLLLIMDKRNKKKYYCKNYTVNQKRGEELAETITGVLITTDKNKEKNSVKDAYNILNDALEHLYPGLNEKLAKQAQDNKEKDKEKEKEKEKDKEKDLTPHSNEEEMKLEKPVKVQKLENNEKKITYSDNLEKELTNLRKDKSGKFFFNFETNCKGVVFIKVDKGIRNEVEVKELVKYVVDKVRTTKEQVSRNIARFLPIESAMKAKFDIFTQNAPKVLDKYFPKEDNNSNERISWKVEFKARNNNSINKMEYLDYIINYIDKGKYYVDYKTPKLTIIIEITNDLLCISVLEDYYENKMYNLLTLCKSDEELKLEREKLINKQQERESEKSKVSESMKKGGDKKDDLGNDGNNEQTNEKKEEESEGEDDINII